MVRKYCAAGASILVISFAVAALSGSACAIHEIGWDGAGSGGGNQPSTCSDGIKNGDETGDDCGGSCSPCTVVDVCEIGIDCGGSCTEKCAEGKACAEGTDCASKFCIAGTCVSACNNTTKDGNESDTDCGGSCMEKCDEGKTCGKDADCVSTFCIQGACVSPCNNLTKDGDETDDDCGGSCLTKCSVTRDCKGDADCFSGKCDGSTCIPGPASLGCFDTIKNNLETDEDCGGGACAPCASGQTCLLDSDCAKNRKCKGDQTLKTCQMP